MKLWGCEVVKLLSFEVAVLKLAGFRFHFPGHEGGAYTRVPGPSTFLQSFRWQRPCRARRSFAPGQEGTISLISKPLHALPDGPATRPRDERHAPVRCRTDRSEIPK
jgi:hypothetical protein